MIWVFQEEKLARFAPVEVKTDFAKARDSIV